LLALVAGMVLSIVSRLAPLMLLQVIAGGAGGTMGEAILTFSCPAAEAR
jgi:hypothetical protein